MQPGIHSHHWGSYFQEQRNSRFFTLGLVCNLANPCQIRLSWIVIQLSTHDDSLFYKMSYLFFLLKGALSAAGPQKPLAGQPGGATPRETETGLASIAEASPRSSPATKSMKAAVQIPSTSSPSANPISGLAEVTRDGVVPQQASSDATGIKEVRLPQCLADFDKFSANERVHFLSKLSRYYFVIAFLCPLEQQDSSTGHQRRESGEAWKLFPVTGSRRYSFACLRQVFVLSTSYKPTLRIRCQCRCKSCQEGEAAHHQGQLFLQVSFRLSHNLDLR